ncbi:MAG: GtrA family protein [Ruminococcaceae bacterium]|nr:GtrA family protein [Oscillospiraceae bacterium]
MDFKSLLKKYRDVIPYIIFGVLTTIVNIAVYWFMAHPLGISVMPSTVIAWLGAVLFAYITNRKWVFRSEANTANAVLKEILSFFLCRLATGAVDWACMFIFVDILNLNDVVIKFMANILVIILNYVASKLFIFKRKKGN